MGKKIFDQFTNLKVSRQRRWQLRHPESQKALRKRFDQSEKGRVVQRRYRVKLRTRLDSRVYQREYQRDLNCWIKRYLNAKSYQDERSAYA